MLRVVLFGLFLPFSAFAEALPAPISDAVSDFAGILTASAETEVTGLVQRIRDETGVHIVVATMDRISDHGGGTETITSYTKALFNHWGVGAADRNDGILILVVAEDRVVRIALGSGYDAVYDGRAQRVIDTAIQPEFKQGRFAKGILDGVQSARDRLVVPHLAGQPIGVNDGFPDSGLSPVIWLGAIGAALAGLFGFRSVRNARRRCPKCQQLTLNRQTDVIREATSASFGTGILHLNCTGCGHTERRPYTIPARQESRRFGGRGRGGGDGGSGGFGGGRSSGGGASGRW